MSAGVSFLIAVPAAVFLLSLAGCFRRRLVVVDASLPSMASGLAEFRLFGPAWVLLHAGGDARRLPARTDRRTAAGSAEGL